MGMQGQMMGVQSTLERILSVIQGSGSNSNAPSSSAMFSNGNHPTQDQPPNSLPHVDPQLQQMMPPSGMLPSPSTQTTTPISGQHFFPPSPSDVRGGSSRHQTAMSAPPPQPRHNFPPLPGFAPPVSVSLMHYEQDSPVTVPADHDLVPFPLRNL